MGVLQSGHSPENVRRGAFLGWEFATVLTLAIGLSAARSVLSLLWSLGQEQSISAQKTMLNRSEVAELPWLDLGFQLVSLLGLVLPVLIVVLFVRVRGERLSEIGWTSERLPARLLLGLAGAVGIGMIGLGVYLLAFHWGLSRPIIPSDFASWWSVPVLIIAACGNSLVEEVVLVGYFSRRAEQLGWSNRTTILLSASLRAVYHAYQGGSGLFGNFIMGAGFMLYFKRTKSIVALLVAHAAIDIFAFVGYQLLRPWLGWLPG